MEMELLRELLTSANESTQIARSDEAAQGYRGVTNQGLTPNSLTPASAHSRDTLMDGKHRVSNQSGLDSPSPGPRVGALKGRFHWRQTSPLRRPARIHGSRPDYWSHDGGIPVFLGAP